MLYRIQLHAAPRAVWPVKDRSLESLLNYFDALKDKYLGNLKPSEIRVTLDPAGRATVAGEQGDTVAVGVLVHQPDGRVEGVEGLRELAVKEVLAADEEALYLGYEYKDGSHTPLSRN